MKDQRSQSNRFSSGNNRMVILEKTIFGITRILTYVILFCACFIFWDIISKGSRKLFTDDGFINWSFLSESPQTLHVIEHNGEISKLSSDEYFKFKEELSESAWDELNTRDEFTKVQKRLKANLIAATEVTSNEVQKSLLTSFIQDEKTEATEKFNYWMELLENASSHAPDFQVSSEDMPYLVGRFILAFLDQTKLKYSLLETELSFFQALHYPKIDHLSSQSIQKIKLAYFNLLEEHLHKIWETYIAEKKNLKENINDFLQNRSPTSFSTLESQIIGYMENPLLLKENSANLWEAITSDLQWIGSEHRIEVPSKDYAYSGGGIFPAIAGTILLVGGAMLIALMLGVCCAIFLSEYGKSGKFLSLVRLSILNLAGVPSIIFGLFGMGLFVIFLDWNVSILAGWFTLAFMVLPIVITASEESLRSIPKGFRESSLALGATKWTMIRTSVLPYAMPGILTSAILGVARVAGETAPIMFTAAFAMRSELPWEGLEHWTDFFFQGVMALPYHIYVISKIPQNEYTVDMQYGTALVFLILVFLLASVSFIIRSRLRRKFNW